MHRCPAWLAVSLQRRLVWAVLLATACGETPSAPANGQAARDAGAPLDAGHEPTAKDSAVAGAHAAAPSTAGAGAGTSALDARVPDAAPSPVDAGAVAGSAAPAADGCGLCAAYAEPMQVGKIGVSELDALSGLASSRKNPGILFAHNDHNRPVVYALDLQGNLHAKITLNAAPSSDIEDIAVGPCGSGQCVFLADIGDNASTRSEYAILRFAEPSVPATASADMQNVSFERFVFSYEDGSHNAEGLMVSPAGTVYIVSKRAEGGVSSIYRLPDPLSSTGTARAVKVQELSIPMASDKAASAAAAHPCGLGFVVRVYDRVYEWKTPAGANFEAAFKVTPTSVAMPDEPQSEAIDYMPDGHGFITSGEGAGAPIVRTACR